MMNTTRVLGDVVRSIEAGRSPKTLERDAAPDEPGVLKVSAVSWGSFDATAAKAMPREFVGPDAHKVRRGDFIVSRANTPELTGAVAIAQADHPNRFLSDKLLRLLIDESQVVPEYLLFGMRAPAARAHIERFASGTSSSMRNIAQDALLRTPLVLPGLEAQREIACRLRSATTEVGVALAALSTQIDDAKQVAIALLEEQFGGTGIVAGVAAAGGMALLHSLARLESGHTPSRRHPEWWGGNVPWLALPDIRKLHGKLAHRTTETINDAGLANSSARLLPAGTVCLCRDASIGFVTMLGRPMATSQHFCNWICDPDRLDPEFLMYAFMASFDQLRALGSGSVLKTIYMPTQ